MILKNWKIKENFIKVLKIYPVVLSCFFVIGALGVLLIHNYNVDEELILKINFSIAIFAGFALILKALKLQFDKFNKKTYSILLLICLGLSIGYYFTLNIDNEWSMIRTFIILFIQGLLFISLPFVKNDDKAEHFVNLAAGRLIISGLLYGIAYGGIAGILFALEELFGLDISYKVYSDFAVVLATTFLPMLWLFGLNYQVEPSKKKLYKVLLSYVCIPLLLVYSAVVYGFIIIKIVFAGFVMPSSIVGHLVLWYSFVSIVVTYLARPYKDNSITKFFYKWYPLISVLPVIVMFIAIFLRINQYGITISRYYLLLGGIWLALMVAYLIFVRFAKKKRLNIVITLSIGLFALISILEPISAYTTAENSQLNRLESIVTKYSDGNTIDIDSMSDDELKQAQSILNYLDWQHDYNFYYDSEELDTDFEFLTNKQVNEILDVNIYYDGNNRDSRRYIYISNQEKDGIEPVIDIQGYNYLFTIASYSFYGNDFIEHNRYKIEVVEEKDDNQTVLNSYIRIYMDDDLIEELSLIECFGDKLLEKKETFGDDESDFVYENQDKSVKIVLTSVDFWYNNEAAISGFNGYILIK